MPTAMLPIEEVYLLNTQCSEISPYVYKLQRVRIAHRGHLLLWAPGPVPFWTCTLFNVVISHS